MIVSLHLIMKRLCRLVGQLEKDAERSSRLADDLKLYLEWSGGSKAGMRKKPNSGKPYTKGYFKVMEEFEKSQANIGVNKVIIRWRADGFAEISIENYEKFMLPQNLAELLDVLRQDTGSSEDHLVGWKSIDELTMYFGKKTSGSYKRHAIVQTIYRLRNSLREAKVNPYLIQNHRRKGYRFCLKKAGPTTMVGSNSSD